MQLRLEFTVEPFLEGRPGPHVRAALDEARRQGLNPEMGPFANTVEGDAAVLLPGLTAIVAAAVEAGANRVSLSLSRCDAATSHPFLDAMEPLVEALDARLLPVSDLAPGDIPLVYEGEILGGVRLPRAHGLLDRLIASVERDIGGKLCDLSREDKQRAVRLLDERGAFDLRRSIDDVADALGVSRITVYNYLNTVSRRARVQPLPDDLA